jgi:DNA invertase Pin-like site-specific DNA recombinase
LGVKFFQNGRGQARAEGKSFGRRPKLTAHRRREALKRLEAGEATREIALSHNVAHTTIARLKPSHAPAE